MNERYKKYLKFVTSTGIYYFEVTLFEFMSTPFTFQRTVYVVLKNIGLAQTCLHKVVVCSKTMDEHIAHLQKVFAVISRYRLKSKIYNCELSKNEVELLGHMVISCGVAVDIKRW